MLKKIIIGSRSSDLARIQAYSVGELLKKKYNHLEIEFYHRPSMGDLNLDMDLQKTNSKGVFTQEFKDLLENGTCDIVVHSWKDLPIENDPKTSILTMGPREDQRDVLFIKKTSIGAKNVKFLTSSPRREYHIKKNLKPFLPFKVEEFSFETIRGNIPTRFKKFLDSNADGFIVAKAAIDRLNGESLGSEFDTIKAEISDVFGKCKFMVLPLSVFPTAAAQGALAIEVSKNHKAYKTFANWNLERNYNLVEWERKSHKQFGGGCHQAMGFSALGSHEGDLMFSSGTHEGEEFTKTTFKPKTQLPGPRFKKDELFSQSEIKPTRSALVSQLSELKAFDYDGRRSQFVITRFESTLDGLKDSEHFLWSSGVKTWYKLAEQGYWIHGSLDGLGHEQLPEMPYLKANKTFWLTNSSAPETGFKNIIFAPVYEIKYKENDLRNLGDKKCFFWMSSPAFELALKLNPAIKDAMHFCGLGRTGETLKRIHPEVNLHYCLNESDFYAKNLK